MLRWILLLVCVSLAGGPPGVLAQTEASPRDTPETTLRPGDLIRLQVYREEALDGEYLVDEVGYVVLPLIGEHRATDIPIRELRAQLLDQFRLHLRNPSIIITPLRRINILGEVQRPGMYALDPTVSLVGAVAMAGGATSAGDLRRIRIIRDNQVIPERVEPGQTISVADVRSGDQIFVERRSWFERNSTFVVSATLSLTSIVITLLRR